MLTGVLLAGVFFNVMSEKMPYDGLIGNWVYYQRWKWNLVPKVIYAEPLSKYREVDASIERMKGVKVSLDQAYEIEEVVKYIRANTKPSDPLLGFPELDFYNFLCDRPEVSRFYLSGLAYPRRQWQQEVLENVRLKKPPVVLYRAGLSVQAFSIGSKKEILTDVVDYIRLHYVVKMVFPGVAVLQRKT